MSRGPNKSKSKNSDIREEIRRTTNETVATYLACVDVFAGLISEVRELSRKKPDTTLNKGKVRIINRVLKDLKSVLESEPENKYLDLLDDDELPQTSDAVLVMVQYESVLKEFPERYMRSVRTGMNDYGSPKYEKKWVTEDFEL